MIEIKKTYKNYVNGKYVRSESGKTFTVDLKDGVYEIPLSSRKDIRDAVVSSKTGFKQWSKTTPFTRMQILYRLSEMIEGNKDSYVELLKSHGVSVQAAKKDVELSIQNLIWFAGLADKWEQLTGNLNPVSGEYFNISHQNPIGVVFSLNKDELSLNSLLQSILPPLTVGCSVISLSDKASVLALKFAEDINNSDLPAGALNILSGKFDQIIDDVSNHVEINAMAIYKQLPSTDKKIIRENASKSLKRIFINPPVSGLESLLPFIETKTVWHPKGR